MIELNAAAYRFADSTTQVGPFTVRLSERRIAVIGANGSGKSTFARLLNGLLTPTSGAVTAAGLDTRHQARAVRRRVGFVFHNPDLQLILPTVAEDVAFGLRQRRQPAKESATAVADILDRLHLAHLADRNVSGLSGGEKQLVALAGVLVLKPETIVLDEPTSLLDLPNSLRLRRLLDELDCQVITVTHDLELAAASDRALYIRHGVIAADGPAASVVAEYRRYHAEQPPEQ